MQTKADKGEEGVKLLVAHILEKSFRDVIQLDGPPKQKTGP